MKFNEMLYTRPDEQAYMQDMRTLLNELKQAPDAETFLPIYAKINTMRRHLKTMMILAEIRHTINTVDTFYDAENAYWDEAKPRYTAMDVELIRIAVEKPYRHELQKEIPAVWFAQGECALRSFDASVIEDLVEENKLKSAYGKLKAGAQIAFDGKTLNLAQIESYTQSPDRAVRKAASDAKFAFFAAHADEFDAIYDRMVSVRNRMAVKLGYADYHAMSFDTMNRIGYDAADIRRLRKAVLAYATPQAEKITKAQQERLGLDTIAYYDLNLEFADGNAVPHGAAEDLVQYAAKMYHEMSPETASFIDVMVENEMWDLLARPNKEMGGYETEIPEYGVPFIFANFNGTSGDVDVLTHEAGHAFQTYMASAIENPDLATPTMEGAEIDSMSMEFFAYPWMDLFFKEQADRYRFSHMCRTIRFLPYGVLVDHFQEEVYTHPKWTPQERKACWRKLEKQYLPYKNYDGCALLEDGGWWYQQNHIFRDPFYYIDYVLAQICAQQFFLRKEEKDAAYWQDYLSLLRLGGTKNFIELVREAHLQSPFEPETLRHVMEELEKWLQNMQTKKL